jgi:NADH-quinone oxidoreductase subunit G
MRAYVSRIVEPEEYQTMSNDELFALIEENLFVDEARVTGQFRHKKNAEFLERVGKGEKLPLLTSCCPAWVKFVENEYPEFKANVSTCRSPQQMFSAVLKEYYRDEANAKGKKTYVVSIMPCTAKKMEAMRPNSYTHGEKDTDIVLTTHELIRMIDAHGINFETMPSEACDMPFGIGSGGGVIFGATGGVTEAVLRRLTEGHDSATLSAIAECGVRGDDGIKEITVLYNGIDVKICVASGLANARKVLEDVKSGAKEYHFIEVMACPGGCVMGGGQPTDGTKVLRAETRTKGLYAADGDMAIKKSDENPLVDVFYNGYFKGKAHELLHNHE